MAEYIDEIEELYFKNAGFEAEEGSYKKVYSKFLLKMQIAENKNEIKDAYQAAKQEMSELKQRIPEHPVRIGIVGEYFTVMDEHSNQFLQEKLVHLGASVYRFMNITNCHFRAKEAALRPKTREYVQYNMGPTPTWTVNSALDYAKRGGRRDHPRQIFRVYPGDGCDPCAPEYRQRLPYSGTLSEL